MTYIPLIKTCAVSLLWSGLAIGWSLIARWDTLTLSKAFYVLLAYSVIFLTAKVILLTLDIRLFVSSDTPHKLAKRIIISTVAFCLFVYLTTIIIMCSEVLYSELAKRNPDWPVELSNSQNINWFIRISFEHWWFIIVLTAQNIWQFLKHQKHLRKNPDTRDVYEEKVFMQYEIAMYSLVGIPIMLIALINSGNQIGLYYFLIIVFFLPWAAFADIAKKVYHDYWKVL